MISGSAGLRPCRPSLSFRFVCVCAHVRSALFLGVAGFGGAIWPSAGAALLAETFLAAVVQEADARSRAAASQASQTNSTLDELDRHLLREPAALRVLLAAVDVLVHPVHALDDQLAGLAVHAEHLAARRPGRRR